MGLFSMARVDRGHGHRTAARAADAKESTSAARRKQYVAVLVPCSTAPVRSRRQNASRPSQEFNPLQQSLRKERDRITARGPERIRGVHGAGETMGLNRVDGS